jgi:hypothetical protein
MAIERHKSFTADFAGDADKEFGRREQNASSYSAREAFAFDFSPFWQS